VIVDGAHAPALLDHPVVGDYWTGNLHKWPCAPRGTGVLYVAPDRQQTVVPAIASWGDSLGFPRVFDTPGTMDATGWLATPTSLDLLATLGFADHRKDLGLLVEAGAASVADAIGGQVVDVGSPAPTMRLVSLPEELVTDEPSGLRLGAYLAARSGAEVSVTSWASRGFLRLSAHLYNTIDDYTQAASRFATLFADPELRSALSRVTI
jgi:isopenicillin-N epimerase